MALPIPAGCSRLTALAAAVLALPVAAQPVAPGSDSTKSRVENVLTAPARDANIMKPKVPPLLEENMKQPYSMADTGSCKAIAAQVRALEAALGPDVDAPNSSGNPDEASELAAAGAGAAISSIIPGLGLIRIISGAAKEQRHATAAVYAGAVRRGFLKGLGVARGCKPPAAPNFAAR